MYKAILVALCVLVCGSGAAYAQCSSYPYTLTNGTTADATQVMANFNCAALTSGATINAATLTGTTTLPGSGQISATGLTISVSGTTNKILFGADSSSTNYNAVSLNGTLSAGNYIGIQGGGSADPNLYLNTPSSGAIIIRPNAASQVASFNSKGLLVGASSYWVASTQVQIGNGSNTNAPLSLNASGAYALLLGNASNGLYFGVQSSAAAFQFSNGAGSSLATIDGSTGAYTATSDARLKTISRKQRDYSSVIRKLWVGDYVWNQTKKADFGIVAQNAFSVMPDGLGVAKPANEHDRWMVTPSTFGYLALWGVKDIYKLTAQQAEEISALKSAVNGLQVTKDNQAAEIRHLETQVTALERNLRVRTAQQ